MNSVVETSDLATARRKRRMSTNRNRVNHFINWRVEDSATVSGTVSQLTRLLPALTGTIRAEITMALDCQAKRQYRSREDYVRVSTDLAGGEAFRVAALDAGWFVYPRRDDEPAAPYSTEFDGCLMCHGQAVVDSERYADDDVTTERRETPCPACQGERIVRSMTLESWEHFLESAHELTEYYNLDWAAVDSWRYLVQWTAAKNEIVIEIPGEFDDFIQTMIDDYESEATAARWG